MVFGGWGYKLVGHLRDHLRGSSVELKSVECPSRCDAGACGRHIQAEHLMVVVRRSSTRTEDLRRTTSTFALDGAYSLPQTSTTTLSFDVVLAYYILGHFVPYLIISANTTELKRD